MYVQHSGLVVAKGDTKVICGECKKRRLERRRAANKGFKSGEFSNKLAFAAMFGSAADMLLCFLSAGVEDKEIRAGGGAVYLRVDPRPEGAGWVWPSFWE